MANVTVTTTTPNIVVNASSNVVTVDSTESNIVVAQIATIGNSQIIRDQLSVVDTGGDGSLSYANTTGVFTYTGPSQDDANTRIDNAPANVRAHFSVVDNAGLGGLTYSNTTGVFTYQGASNQEVANIFTAIDNGGDGSLTFAYNATTTLGEITYTGPDQDDANARITAAPTQVIGHFSNVSPVNLEANGQISIDESALFSGKTTDDLAEGSTNLYLNGAGTSDNLTEGNTNLFFTNARANTSIEDYLANTTNNPITIGSNINMSENKITMGVGQANTTNSFLIIDRSGDNKSNAEIAFLTGVDGGRWAFTNDQGNVGLTNFALDTDDLSEGSTNLYYTTARANSAIDAYTGNINNVGNVNVSRLFTVNRNDISVNDNKTYRPSGRFSNLANDAVTLHVVKNVVDSPNQSNATAKLSTSVYKIGTSSANLSLQSNVQPSIDITSPAEQIDSDHLLARLLGDEIPYQIFPNNQGDGWTIEGWFRWNDNGETLGSTNSERIAWSARGAFGGSSDQGEMDLHLHGTGKIRFRGPSNVDLIQTSTFAFDTWYHVAVVFERGTGSAGGTYTLFVDGAEQDTQTNSNTPMPTTYLRLGDDSIANQSATGAGTSDTMDGYIDELRISKTARYTSNFTAPTTAFTDDGSTLLLVHFEGSDGQTTFSDDGEQANRIIYNANTSKWQFSNDGSSYEDMSSYSDASANSAITTFFGDSANFPFTFNGNIQVQGNIDYVNVEDLLVNDQSITLNYGNASALDAFIYVDRTGDTLNNAHIKWNETTDAWEIYDGTSTFPIPTSTTDLAEGTNLYYTDARSRSAISLTTQSPSGNGALSYNSTTGVFDFTPPDVPNNTDELSEGATNLYYTDARSRSAISVSTGTPSGNGSLTYTSGTGVFDFVPADVPDDTDELSEGATNLYYTTDRANAAIIDYLDGTNVVISSDSNITTTANIQGDYVIADTFFIGDLDGAVVQDVQNSTGATLVKGQAVYLNGGYIGDNPNVALADADDATKMPALGIVYSNIADTEVGQVTTSGVMNYESHGFTIGADLYIDTTTPGGLTETAPTGESGLIQKIGKVVSPNHIIVQGAFRTNQTPNLNDGNIFVGNASNQAVTADLSNFGYEIVSNANIETTANIINEDAIISRDSIPSGEFQEVIPASGGNLYPGYFFGLAQTSVVIDVGDAGESFSRGTSSITGTGVAIKFQDYTGNGNANLNGVTFYLGGTDWSGQFSTYAMYTDSGLTTLANSEVLGVDGGQGAGGWLPEALDGNVLSSYVIGDQDIKTTYSDSAFTIRDDYYGQDIITYDSVVSGGGNNIGNVDIDLRTNINADLQVNSGDILHKDGKRLNYTFTGTGFDLDNSMQSYDGYVPIILNHNYTPGLGFETGFQARQWSDQANTLFSVPRFAMMKFPTGNSNPLDTANVTNTGASTFIMADGDFSGVMDSKIQRKRDYVYTSNTSQVYLEGAAAHSVGSILYRTDTSNTEVISQGTLGGGAFKTRAYVAQGIIAFRTMQPSVAANINSTFPYNEGTDSADSTVVFINDKLNVGNEEDANLAYSFPKTPGTNGQVLQLDSNYDLQWANLGAGSGTVTSVDVAGGSGLTSTGGPITSSGTITVDVGAGYGITVTADAVEVTNSEIQAQANIAIGNNSNIVLTDTDATLTNTLTTANVNLKQFQETVVNMGNQGGNIAAVAEFNAANGSIFTFTATSDFEISQIPNAQPGSSYTIKVTQDGTGDKVLTSTFKFAGGDKTMSVAADAIDVISVVYDGTDYLASLTKAYA